MQCNVGIMIQKMANKKEVLVGGKSVNKMTETRDIE